MVSFKIRLLIIIISLMAYNSASSQNIVITVDTVDVNEKYLLLNVVNNNNHLIEFKLSNYLQENIFAYDKESFCTELNDREPVFLFNFIDLKGRNIWPKNLTGGISTLEKNILNKTKNKPFLFVEIKGKSAIQKKFNLYNYNKEYEIKGINYLIITSIFVDGKKKNICLEGNYKI